MDVKIGTEQNRQDILSKYPHTAQVIRSGGYIVVALEQNEIIGFTYIFRRKIPAPVGEITEDFINVVEVFSPGNRNNGIGSLMIDKCKEIAQESGSYQVRAYCDINNTASHRLWVKNRFGISPVKAPDGTICGSFVTFTL